VAKRSPILGYNHNVRYRGLIFHVQTEDSGVLSPHLFTHLFHTGVIVSTRKLVYDSGSAEESIKSLMQAQHKAVLKDLKRGHFDDKIDQYLSGTPGLLSRDAAAVARAGSEIDEDSGPVRTEPIQVAGADEVAAARTATSGTTQPRVPAIPPPRTQTAERVSAPRTTDSAPEIEIQLELDEPDEISPPRPRTRAPRDTDVAPGGIVDSNLGDHTRPTLDVAQLTHTGSTIVRPRDAAAAAEKRPPSAGLGAATLPPARPITRPPNARSAMAPPQVVSRPIMGEDGRRRETDAVEVYAPPPSGVDPPGDRSAGQYAQHKKPPTQQVPALRPGTQGGAAVPAGLGRPGRGSPGIPTPATPPAIPAAARPATVAAAAPPPPAVPPPTPPPTPRPRTPTPARPGSPTQSRAASAASPASGVVMTRPAVIVGAPTRPTPPPRVRKAREDEGRGFGQGLISEKSLDEVILAYLSEDADEK
jgi:hypothetical protein